MNTQAQTINWGFNNPQTITVNTPTTCSEFSNYLGGLYSSSGNAALVESCSNAFSQIFQTSSDPSQVCDGSISLAAACPTFSYIPASATRIAFFNYPIARVGIGTQNPTAELEVIGNIKASGNVSATRITFGNGTSITSAGVNYWKFGKLGQSTINTIYTTGTDRVGIGTVQPTQSLEVVGNIKTNGIVNAGGFQVNGSNLIATQWANESAGIGYVGNARISGVFQAKEIRLCPNPGTCPDFVFGKNYKLMKIAALKAFIEKNKHLPLIPSAKVMESEGMEIKKLNLLFLQKIEELTLYMIELKNEVEELKKK